MVEKSVYETKFATDRCYRELSKILFNFETADKSAKPKDIFERMAEKEVTESLSEIDTAIDFEKVKKYDENYLFCNFHHLFEYESAYYSYLIAKL